MPNRSGSGQRLAAYLHEPTIGKVSPRTEHSRGQPPNTFGSSIPPCHDRRLAPAPATGDVGGLGGPRSAAGDTVNRLKSRPARTHRVVTTDRRSCDTRDLVLNGLWVDTKCVNRDVAPVIAAQALLAHGIDDDVIVAYLRRTWHLDDIDAQAALAAARLLVRRRHGTEIRAPDEK